MDDGDSGNEEPKDHTEYVQQKQAASNVGSPNEPPSPTAETSDFASGSNLNSVVASTSSENQAVRQISRCGNPRNILQEKLSRLTSARSPEDLKTVDPEVIQNIPTEGYYFRIWSFIYFCII